MLHTHLAACFPVATLGSMWEWILRVWDHDGKNIKSDQDESIDMD